jgi:hypothetical protein
VNAAASSTINFDVGIPVLLMRMPFVQSVGVPPETPAFLNLIHLLLLQPPSSSRAASDIAPLPDALPDQVKPDRDSPVLTDAQNSGVGGSVPPVTVKTASPAQIAEALRWPLMGSALPQSTTGMRGLVDLHPARTSVPSKDKTSSRACEPKLKKPAGPPSLDSAPAPAVLVSILPVQVLPPALPDISGVTDPVVIANFGKTAHDSLPPNLPPSNPLPAGLSPPNESIQTGAESADALSESAVDQATPLQAPMAFEARLVPVALAPGVRSPASQDPVISSLAATKRDPHQAAPSKQAQSTVNSDDSPAAPSVGPMRADSTAMAVPVTGGTAHLPTIEASRASMPDPKAVSAPLLPEPVAPSATVQASGMHVKEMTLRIAAADASTVEVQVNQRQGHVYVAVRTADEGLQTSLRQELLQLVNSLDRAGFRTETFVPPCRR